ncbi:hypothetical protein DWY80_26615 [Bacteroides ovatus]|nr:hypothetical protein DWY80_26615 [Bacteroides ovatus]
MPGCSCPGLCKAWQEKIPERSEDDFLLANQPIGLPWSIRRTRTIFAGKKLKYEPRNRVNLKIVTILLYWKYLY